MMQYSHEQILSAWSVRFVLSPSTIPLLKRQKTNTPIYMPTKAKRIHQDDQDTNYAKSATSSEKILVYEEYFDKLLNYPKNLRDQLLFELPILQALRTGEVVTIQVKDVDFVNNDLYIWDSKKYKRCPIPLDPAVDRHFMEYIKASHLKPNDFVIRHEGYRGRRPVHPQATAFTVEAVVKVWRKYCQLLGIPEMSPRMGRARFACRWHFEDGKSIYGLMVILRHTHFETTVRYLEKIISYADVKREFYQGMKTPVEVKT